MNADITWAVFIFPTFPAKPRDLFNGEKKLVLHTKLLMKEEILL